MYLRKATIDDAMDILAWRNDPQTRAASFNKEEIDPESHIKWFRGKLNDEDCELFILTAGQDKLGHIRVDISGSTGTISYMINPEHRGKGYGTEIIRLLDTAVDKKVSVLSAFVEKENTASQKCFEKNGYNRSEDGDAIKYTKLL
jgi:spore coat polysaccharide biosynthesis protein SpsF